MIKFRDMWDKTKNFMIKYDFSQVMGFSFFNGLIWILMSIAYLHFINLPESTWGGRIYSTVFAIGHLGLFSIGLWIILQLVRFCGRKTFRITAIILSTLLIFLLFADIVVYAQFRFHINIPMISLFCSPAAFELVSFPLVMILSLIVFVIIVAVAEWGVVLVTGKFRYPKCCIICFCLVILSFLSFNAAHAWFAFNGTRQYLIRTDALPLKFAMTATRFFMRRGYTPEQQIQTSVTGSVMKYPLQKLNFQQPGKKKNVILILVDSMRADMFNPSVMPRLYQMSEKLPSVKFMQHFSGGNCTKTGVFSLFYGIPGFYFDQAFRCGSGAAIIDSFIANDYDIKIFSSGTLASPPFNRTVFVNVPNINPHVPGTTKLARDKSCFKQFSKFLKERNKNKPYFAFLFLDGLHGNSIEKGFKRKFGSTMTQVNYLNISNDEKSRNELLTFTKDATNYMDYALWKFFKENNISEEIARDTVVIITADHGNEYGETQMKNWGHNSNFAKYQTQVPLVIFGLDRPAQTVNYRTSSLDVSATIMQDVLGCTNDIADYSLGKNLFDPSPRPYIISTSYLETALICEDKVFAMTVYGIMQEYDLEGNFIKASIPPEGMKYLLDAMAKYSK
ncbi:MAG: DUF3413 domain-containing protein [Lentisphaerae bacterium]|nr:DUF3413 domain-containing protein [Lentisphaerota bacterium]